MQKAAYHPQRMDTDRNARVRWDPIRRIRIHDCKNQTCFHVHPGWMRTAVAMQQSTATPTGSCLPPTKPRGPNRDRRVPDTAQRIDYRIHQVQGVGGRVARLYWYSRCVRTWRWRGCAWGKHGMHPRCIPLGMARGHKTGHRILHQSYRMTYELRSGNGRASDTLASY